MNVSSGVEEKTMASSDALPLRTLVHKDFQLFPTTSQTKLQYVSSKLICVMELTTRQTDSQAYLICCLILG
jgi:hypothetical protein